MHDWTDEEKIQVAELLRQGASGGQIADKLDFRVSRNAVIGLVHRDKQLSKIGFKGQPRRPIPNIKKAKPMPPDHKPENRFVASIKGGILRKPTATSALPPPQSKDDPVVSAGIQPVGIPMLEIRESQCRWPLWKDGGNPHFIMCGAATQLDRPYCDGHRARATTPARAR